MNLGYYEEARAWRDWLLRAIAGSPRQVQIMYGVGGERWLPEQIVPWLPGYENSAPVFRFPGSKNVEKALCVAAPGRTGWARA